MNTGKTCRHVGRVNSLNEYCIKFADDSSTRIVRKIYLDGDDGFAQIEISEGIAPMNLRKVVHYDFAILKELGSPLHREFFELTKPRNEREKNEASGEELAECLFLFSRPCKDAKEILEREGRDGFRRAAIKNVRAREEATCADCAKAICAFFNTHWEIVFNYRVSATAEEKEYAASMVGRWRRLMDAMSPDIRAEFARQIGGLVARDHQ